MGRWFVNQGDAIRANLISSAACGITVYVTILTPNGEYRRVRSNVPFTTNGTRIPETAVSLISTVPEGEILAMNISTFTANVKRGQCFVQIYVIEQPTMAQGYVYSNYDVVLDQKTEPGPGGGEGAYGLQGLVDPAAGAEFTTITLPSNVVRRYLSFAATLVCTAAAVNRKPTINFFNSGDAANPIARASPGGVAQTGQTVQFAGGLHQGMSDVNDTAALAGDTITFPIPNIFLSESDTISFVTLNLQALDNWGSGYMQFEEWLVF